MKELAKQFAVLATGVALLAVGYKTLSTVPEGAALWKPSSFKDVKFVSVYDGDTFLVDIPGVPDVFGKSIPIRIAHIDAPELHGSRPCERMVSVVATQVLNDLLSRAKNLELIAPARDKYFRILTDVRVDGKVLLSQYMLGKKLAIPYEGDTKPVTDWCIYSE
jgi:micrococcal nuclease